MRRLVCRLAPACLVTAVFLTQAQAHADERRISLSPTLIRDPSAGNVTSLALDPLGKRLAIGHQPDGLWDYFDGILMYSPRGDLLYKIPNPDGKPMYAIAFSPDGKYFAAGGDSGVLRVWEVEGDGEPRAFKDLGHICAAAFSADSTMLAVGTLDRVKVWDWRKKEELSTIATEGTVAAIRFSSDDKYLAFSQFDRDLSIQVYTCPHFKQRLRVKTEGRGMRFCLSADARFLAFPDSLKDEEGTARCYIRRFDLGEKQELGQIGPFQAEIADWQSLPTLCFSPDATLLFVSQWNGRYSKIAVWSVEHGYLGSSPAKHKDKMAELFTDQSGSLLASSTSEGELILWQRKKSPVGACDRTPKGQSPEVKISLEPTHVEAITRSDFRRPVHSAAMALAPSGKYIAIQHYHSEPIYPPDRVLLWDPLSGEQVDKMHPGQGVINAVAFTPDGKYLATAGACGLLQIWDTNGNVERCAFETPSKHNSATAFSGDGRLVAAGDGDFVTVWDWHAKKKLYTFGSPNRVHKIQFSADNKYLAFSASQNGTLKVYRGPNYDLHFTLEPKSGSGHFAMSSDGRFLAVRDESKDAAGRIHHFLRVYDVRRKRELYQTKDLPDFATSLCFSPDGLVLYAGLCNGDITALNPQNGQQLTSVHKHTAPVKYLSIDQSGSVLVSGTERAELIVWEVKFD